MQPFVMEPSARTGEPIQVFVFSYGSFFGLRYFLGGGRDWRNSPFKVPLKKLAGSLGSNFWKVGNLISYSQLDCRNQVENSLILTSTAVVSSVLELRAGVSVVAGFISTSSSVIFHKVNSQAPDNFSGLKERRSQTKIPVIWEKQR